MALSIELNGDKYTGFKSASVIASIGAVSRGFTFTTSATQKELFPVKLGDEVKILADDIPILGGFVERISAEYKKESPSHDIRAAGRSYLSDIVDSSVPTQTEFLAKSLEEICQEILNGLGIKGRVINNAGKIEPFDDLTTAKVGQKAFDFLNSYSLKRQVLLTTDGFYGLILARAGTGTAPGGVSHTPDRASNNIISAEFEYNNSQRYNKYSIKSELNAALQALSKTPKEISDQGDFVIDPAIRKTRQFEAEAEESMDEFTALDRAKWEANIRKAKSFNYSVTIQGHSREGKLWLPNTIVRVADYFANINAKLLIKTVNYSYTMQGGSTVRLDLTYKNAFTLELEQKERESYGEEAGDEFGL